MLAALPVYEVELLSTIADAVATAALPAPSGAILVAHHRLVNFGAGNLGSLAIMVPTSGMRDVLIVASGLPQNGLIYTLTATPLAINAGGAVMRSCSLVLPNNVITAMFLGRDDAPPART